jgi:methylmalonyl-CoA mutase C-terminal domain/subunit
MTMERKTRVLVAKAGLDGHDVGAKVVARSLMEAGFDVRYTGLRKSPEEIVAGAKEWKADVIGLSLLSGSHLPCCQRMSELLREQGLTDVVWVVGGVIPEEDVDSLHAMGVDRVLPVGTPLKSITDFIRERTR